MKFKLNHNSCNKINVYVGKLIYTISLPTAAFTQYCVIFYFHSKFACVDLYYSYFVWCSNGTFVFRKMISNFCSITLLHALDSMYQALLHISEKWIHFNGKFCVCVNVIFTLFDSEFNVINFVVVVVILLQIVSGWKSEWQ